ncbi:hypothetical protein FQA39_LY19128 [Lamprigera yunnana]|nr:hypothetical protein FQA39_LY19128 [Lamprigera yunnana]
MRIIRIIERFKDMLRIVNAGLGKAPERRPGAAANADQCRSMQSMQINGRSHADLRFKRAWKMRSQPHPVHQAKQRKANQRADQGAVDADVLQIPPNVPLDQVAQLLGPFPIVPALTRVADVRAKKLAILGESSSAAPISMRSFSDVRSAASAASDLPSHSPMLRTLRAMAECSFADRAAAPRAALPQPCTYCNAVVCSAATPRLVVPGRAWPGADPSFICRRTCAQHVAGVVANGFPAGSPGAGDHAETCRCSSRVGSIFPSSGVLGFQPVGQWFVRSAGAFPALAAAPPTYRKKRAFLLFPSGAHPGWWRPCCQHVSTLGQRLRTESKGPSGAQRFLIKRSTCASCTRASSARGQAANLPVPAVDWRGDLSHCPSLSQAGRAHQLQPCESHQKRSRTNTARFSPMRSLLRGMMAVCRSIHGGMCLNSADTAKPVGQRAHHARFGHRPAAAQRSLPAPLRDGAKAPTRSAQTTRPRQSAAAAGCAWRGAAAFGDLHPLFQVAREAAALGVFNGFAGALAQHHHRAAGRAAPALLGRVIEHIDAGFRRSTPHRRAATAVEHQQRAHVVRGGAEGGDVVIGQDDAAGRLDMRGEDDFGFSARMPAATSAAGQGAQASCAPWPCGRALQMTAPPPQAPFFKIFGPAG